MIKDIDIKQALAFIPDCWHEGMNCYLIGTKQHTFYFWPDNIGYADGTVSVNISIDHEPQIKLQYIPSDEWFILGEGYRHTIFDWLIDHEITGIVQAGIKLITGILDESSFLYRVAVCIH